MKSSVLVGLTILSTILILALEGFAVQYFTNPLANMTEMENDEMNISTAMNETALNPIFSEGNIKESREPTPPPHKNSGTRSETPLYQDSDSCIPQLLSPVEGAIMSNKDEYQTDNSDRIWLFDWNDVPGAIMYHLYVKGPEATEFLINEDVPVSEYIRDMSHGYIADQYRLNWRWGVKAYVNGQWCYSPERHFDVEPMRIRNNPRDEVPVRDEAPMRELNESEWIRGGGEPFSPPNTEVSASVTIRSSWLKSYDVYVDGAYIGTEGTGSDILDGVYSLKVPGEMRHTIVVLKNGKSYPDGPTPFQSGVPYTFTI